MSAAKSTVSAGAALTAPHALDFPYRRTLGPVVGRFLGQLKQGRIVGVRTHDGKVLVPPSECDPETGHDTEEFVGVGDTGTVRSWTFVHSPRADAPLDRPFAWALIELDGADTALLHVVDAPEEAFRSGMRVRARWRKDRVGSIHDIECFESAPGSARNSAATPIEIDPEDDINVLDTPIDLRYTYTAGQALSRFLRQIEKGRIVGQRCSECHSVYVPPLGSCPADGVPTHEEVEVSERGTVESFSIINVPFHGQSLQIPYVLGWIRLDGADTPFPHVVAECPADEVEVGMVVEAVWATPEERGPTFESIRHFRPASAGPGDS